MKKDTKKETSPQKKKNTNLSDLPGLDIIDLDADTDNSNAEGALSDHDFDDDFIEDLDAESPAPKPKRSFRFNIHHALLLAFAAVIIAVVYKISTWGVRVDLEEIFKDGYGSYDNTFDSMLPLITMDGDPVYKTYGEDTGILFLGNSPFADDRDSEDNLVNIIQRKTGATVYNCSYSDSYLAAQCDTISPETHLNEILNFYWLCWVPLHEDIASRYRDGIRLWGEDCPPEVLEIYETLTSVDFNTIDVIAIMYDASDYLAGHGMYSDENPTDIRTFTGNMSAGIQLLQQSYPHIRIIVMSPTYAYGLDEDGNYVSSDIQRYGQDVLSTYVIKQAEACSWNAVTFVDNLYGTVTSDDAPDCLEDHLHLNAEGREKVADRFIDALTYYNHRAE